MSNSIKFKTTFIGEHTTYLTLTERVNTFVIFTCRMKIKLNSAHGLSIVVVVISKFFVNFFHCHKFRRLSNYCRGKIQLNETHWTPISNVSICLRCDFCQSTTGGSLGSVGKLIAETNFDFPAPPFNHISGICRNLLTDATYATYWSDQMSQMYVVYASRSNNF